jgi:hypothetical protein
MATMNISLPDDLKERMETVTGVKWSHVAADAFEREVKARTLKGGNMQAAVERLKASRDAFRDSSRQEGIESGKLWAMDEAEWGELEAICGIDETASELEWSDFCVAGDYVDGQIVAGWFGLDDRLPNPQELEGFIIGARLVKNEVDAAK